MNDTKAAPKDGLRHYPYPESDCWTCRHVLPTGHCGCPKSGPCTEAERQLYEPQLPPEAR